MHITNKIANSLIWVVKTPNTNNTKNSSNSRMQNRAKFCAPHSTDLYLLINKSFYTT